MRIYRPILDVVEQAAQDGLREVAEHVLEESNKRTPKDDGDLIASGGVGVDDLRANVAYKSFYAPWIHERVDFKHDDGGEAKYLENAVEAETSNLAEIMARAARGVAGG